MKLSEMICKYDLHDSLIEDVNYFHNSKRLIFEIELCNWKQSSFQVGEPEMVKVLIIFTGVKKFVFDPESKVFQSDEILETNLIKNDDVDNETIKIVLNGEKDIKIIEIVANDVTLEISKSKTEKYL